MGYDPVRPPGPDHDPDASGALPRLEGELAEAEQPARERTPETDPAEYVDDGYTFVDDDTHEELCFWVSRHKFRHESWRAAQMRDEDHGDSYDQPEPTPDWDDLEESAQKGMRGFLQELGHQIQNGDTAAVDKLWAGLGFPPEEAAIVMAARDAAIDKARRERQETGLALLRSWDQHYSANTELAIDEGPPQGVNLERYANYLRLLAGKVGANLALTESDLEQVALHHELHSGRGEVRLTTSPTGAPALSYRRAPNFELVTYPYDSRGRQAFRLGMGIQNGLHPRYISQRLAPDDLPYPAVLGSGRRPLVTMAGDNASPPQIRPGDRNQALASNDYARFSLDVPDRPKPRPDVEFIVHTGNIHQDIAILRKHFGRGMMIADGRQNGRNHGFAAIRAFEWAGVDMVRASSIKEALYWRARGAQLRIRAEGAFGQTDLRAALAAKRDIELAVRTLDELSQVLAAANAVNRKARVWIEMDMGDPMGSGPSEPNDTYLQVLTMFRENPTRLELSGLFNRLSAPDDPSHPRHQIYFQRMEAACELASDLPGVEPICQSGEALTRRLPNSKFPQAIELGPAGYGLVTPHSPLSGLGLVPAITLRAKVAAKFTVPPGKTVSYVGSKDVGGGLMAGLQLGYNGFTPLADYHSDPEFRASVPGAEAPEERPEAVGQPTMNNAYFRVKQGQVKLCQMLNMFAPGKDDTSPAEYIPRGGHIFDVPLGVHGGEVVRYVQYPGQQDLVPVTETAPYSTEARVVVKYSMLTKSVQRFRALIGDDVTLTVKVDSAAEEPPAETAAPVEQVSTIKANAYGHELVKAGRAAIAGGADKVAVGSVREALVMRREGLFYPDGTEAPIVCWFHAPDADYDSAINANIEIGVKNLDELIPVIQAARRVGKMASICLEAPTGLYRGAATPAEFEEMVRLITHAFAEGELDITTIYQHFASHDSAPNLDTDLQDAVLGERLATCRKLGLFDVVSPTGARPTILTQAAASIAIDRRDLAYDSVAPGTELYFGEESFRIEAPIWQSEYVPRSRYLEYGSGWLSPGTTIAVAQLGTGNGLPALMKGNATVAIAGHRYPVVDIGPDFLVIDTKGTTFPSGTILVVDQIAATAAAAGTNEVKFATCIHGMPIDAATEAA